MVHSVPSFLTYFLTEGREGVRRSTQEEKKRKVGAYVPGARFTKYLTIYRKIIISLS